MSLVMRSLIHVLLIGFGVWCYLDILGLVSLGLVTDTCLYGFPCIALAAVIDGLGRLTAETADSGNRTRLRSVAPSVDVQGVGVRFVPKHRFPGGKETGLWMRSDRSLVGALDWANALGIYAVATLLSALSFLTVGLSGTEAVMIVLLLSTEGYGVADAVLITLVCRLLTLWLSVILGWGAAGVSRLGNPLP